MSEKKFDIPPEHGGNTPENVKKVSERIQEIGKWNSHFDDMELAKIAIDEVFGDDSTTGRKVGGM